MVDSADLNTTKEGGGSPRSVRALLRTPQAIIALIGAAGVIVASVIGLLRCDGSTPTTVSVPTSQQVSQTASPTITQSASPVASQRVVTSVTQSVNPKISVGEQNQNVRIGLDEKQMTDLVRKHEERTVELVGKKVDIRFKELRSEIRTWALRPSSSPSIPPSSQPSTAKASTPTTNPSVDPLLQKAADLVHEGSRFYSEGDLDRTIANCRAATALSDRLPVAHMGLGLALYDKGEMRAAARELTLARQYMPGVAIIHTRLAKALLQAGKTGEAAKACVVGLATHPAHAPLYVVYGEAMEESSKPEIALTLYRRAIALDGSLYQTHNKLGELLADTGDRGGAIAAFRQAIAVRPDLPTAYINLGSTLPARGDFEEAETAFRKARELVCDGTYGGYFTCSTNGAEVTIELDSPEAATAVTYLGAGVCLGSRGVWKEAIAQYRLAHAIRPESVAVLTFLADALMRTNELDEAAQHANKAVLLDPGNAAAYMTLAKVLLEKGQTDDGIAAAREATRFAPKNPYAHDLLARAYDRSGEFDRAIEVYRQTIKLAPQSAPTHGVLGCCLIKAGRSAEALPHLWRAVELSPKHPVLNLWLINGLLANNDFENAIKESRRAVLSMSPPKGESFRNAWAMIYYLQAQIYSCQRKTQSALDALYHALELDPTLKGDAKTNANLRNIRRELRFEVLVED